MKLGYTAGPGCHLTVGLFAGMLSQVAAPPIKVSLAQKGSTEEERQLANHVPPPKRKPLNEESLYWI